MAIEDLDSGNSNYDDIMEAQRLAFKELLSKTLGITTPRA